MGGIDSIFTVAGDRHPQVTWNGEHACLARRRVNSDKDHSIGAGVVLVRALVNAQQQDIDTLSFFPVRQRLAGKARDRLRIAGGARIGIVVSYRTDNREG